MKSITTTESPCAPHLETIEVYLFRYNIVTVIITTQWLFIKKFMVEDGFDDFTQLSEANFIIACEIKKDCQHLAVRY
jgi:hypothetical protein